MKEKTHGKPNGNCINVNTMCLLNIYYTFFCRKQLYTARKPAATTNRIEKKKKNNTPYTSRPGDYLVEKQIF